MSRKRIPQPPDPFSQAASPTRRPSGGLYRNVTMSVKTANILVLICIAALVLTICFLVAHNGFTVSFDTDGGSFVDSQKALHGDRVTLPAPPVKEGYVFTGWYFDRACTRPLNPDTDTVTESVTLYAGWQPQEEG